MWAYVGKNQSTTRYASITCEKQGLSTKTSTTVVAVLPTCEGAWGCWTIQLQRREILCFTRKVERLKIWKFTTSLFAVQNDIPIPPSRLFHGTKKIGEHFSNFNGRHRCDSLSPCGWKQIHSWWAIFQRVEFLRFFFSDFLFERSFLVTQGVDELTPTYFLDSLMVFQDDFVSILENPPKASLLDPNGFDWRGVPVMNRLRFEMLGAWLLCFEDEEAKAVGRYKT